MKVKLTFAALALMAAGCSNQEFTTVQEDANNSPCVITLQASMPQLTDEAATRATYESDGEAVSGVVMKWTDADKLKLCFKHGGNCYHKDATIVPGSISADGKEAKFTWEMPAEIGDGDAFDFYAVYQRKIRNSDSNSTFKDGTTEFKIDSEEYQNVSLNQTGEYGDGIINPMLLFSAKNTTKAGLGTLKLNLEHTGWIMALHLKNSTGAEMDFPNKITFQHATESTSSFIWNGSYSYPGTVKMDVSTGTVTSSEPRWGIKQSIGFGIGEYSSYPFYNQKLAAGAEKVLYRWVVSTPQVEEMWVLFSPKGAPYFYTTNHLPAKTGIEKGILS